MATVPGLLQHSKLETSDRDEARALLDQMYDLDLRRFAAPPETRWEVAISQVIARDFTSADIRVPGVLDVVIRGEDHVIIDTVVSGTAEFTRGQDTGRYRTGDSFIAVTPRGEWVSICQHIGVHAVTLPVSLLADTAFTTDDASSRTWEFSASQPVAGRARAWRQATRFADDLLANPEMVSPMTIGSVGRLLAATALSVFPNTAVTGTTIEDRRDAHPDTLRRAISYIEANPDLDLTVRDISRAAFVTPRAIQLAFRRHMGTTPMAYLRRVRLELARADLQAAVPGDGQTVTSIAARWGYALTSRFAADYKTVYGEYPHVTLRSI